MTIDEEEVTRLSGASHDAMVEKLISQRFLGCILLVGSKSTVAWQACRIEYP